jgi:acylphosphatase
MTLRRIRAVVRGRVQGVGFRWFVREAARGMGVSGSVRNLPDGSVEVDASGTAADVDRLLDRLRAGPPGARVIEVEVEERADDSGLPNPFEILR